MIHVCVHVCVWCVCVGVGVFDYIPYEPAVEPLLSHSCA